MTAPLLRAGVGDRGWRWRVTGYQFVSTWRLAAPVTTVYEALARPDGWQAGWRWFAHTEPLTTGDAYGVGGRLRCVVRSPLPYSLAFEIERVAAEPPTTLTERVTGDLEGEGRWEFAESGGQTVVWHTWTVRTTKPWMNALAPVAWPAFVWAHHVVMRDGARALSTGLAAPLLSVDSRAARPEPSERLAVVCAAVAGAVVVFGVRRLVRRPRP